MDRSFGGFPAVPERGPGLTASRRGPDETLEIGSVGLRARCSGCEGEFHTGSLQVVAGRVVLARCDACEAWDKPARPR
jgi:hypothetical protein